MYAVDFFIADLPVFYKPVIGIFPQKCETNLLVMNILLVKILLSKMN